MSTGRKRTTTTLNTSIGMDTSWLVRRSRSKGLFPPACGSQFMPYNYFANINFEPKPHHPPTPCKTRTQHAVEKNEGREVWPIRKVNVSRKPCFVFFTRLKKT